MVKTACYEINYAIDKLLEAEIEKWEDTLTCDSSEMVYVDGEEGDYGITKYFEGDVLVMVQYVRGGDEESSYYTAEGLARIKGFIVAAMTDGNLDTALATGLNPVDGCYGFTLGGNHIQARRNQDAKTIRKLRAELHTMRKQQKENSRD